jgi:hypothetical protein
MHFLKAVMNPFRPAVPPAILGGFLLLGVSCSSTEDIGAANSPAAAGQPQPPESVIRSQAPTARSQQITGRLNRYRAESFSVRASVSDDVMHSNVLHTAAARHSIYLNSINASTYRTTGAAGVPTSAVTPATLYVDLRRETVAPTGQFPALYTSPALFNRIAAVTGSSDLLKAAGTANEYYVFRGDVPLTAGGNSEFRGYADADVIDSIWYSRRGRATLMRDELVYIGYGAANDEMQGQQRLPPPGWEILNGQFVGALTTLSTPTPTHRLSVWPKDYSTNIRTFGTDTDLVNIAQDGVENVRHQYAGPPIHITLPTSEPFKLQTDKNAGGIQVGFRKLEADPTQPSIVQVAPRPDILRRVVAIWKGPEKSIGTPLYRTRPPGEFEYTIVGSVTTMQEGFNGDTLRNGELILIPTEPLERQSWYEVRVRLETASYTLPDTDFPANSDAYFTWRFKTGNL